MTRRAGRSGSGHRALGACVVVVALAGVVRASAEQSAGPPATEVIAGLVQQDEGLRPSCRAAFGSRTAAAWCDPAGAGVAFLRSPGRTARRVTGTRALRLSGDPLAVGQRVRIRATPSGRAQLALVIQDGSSLTYARFSGMGSRTLAATAHSRRTDAGLVIRLSTRHRRWSPVVQRTVTPAAPLSSSPQPSAPPAAPPPPAPSPEPTPGQRLVIRECGAAAPETAEDVDAFNALWGAERSGQGWTGGDTTFSTPLPGERTAWIFGDTFIGHVTPDAVRTGGLVRNAIVIQDGACLTTYATGTPDAPDALLHPPDREEWYWLADATVEEEHLHVHAWRMRRTGPGAWDFEVVGTDLVTLALPDLAERGMRRLPAADGVAWGSAIAEDGERTYVYGVHGHADGTPYLHVARTTTELEGPWEYRTADGWSPDPEASADQLPGISHQISVLRDGDEYFLITQDPALGAQILLYRAETPAGPWEEPAEPLATAPPPLAGTFTYNAVAHPQYTAAGRLLISYNVNSLASEVMVDAAVYRPRFMTVPWPPEQPPTRR